MGNYTIAFKSMVEGLGCTMVMPLPITKRTLELGSRHSPEFVCLPFKINLGNYIESLESGAEVLIQAGRSGACRYGYYGELQELILKDLGYKFRMINLFSGGKQFNFINSLMNLSGGINIYRMLRGSYLTLLKINFIDEMENRVRKLRAYEIENGTADNLLRDGMNELLNTDSHCEVISLKRKMRRKFDSVGVDMDRNPVRIGIVGELYVVMEPYANLEIERKLGRLGVEVIRPMCLSSLIKYAVFPFLSHRVSREGKDFMQYELGAHASHSVGHAVEFANRGIDGVMQLYPFTCMPEVSARAVLGNVSRTLKIPVLHLSFGEQTGEAGVDTRIEAFADMLERKRYKKLPNRFMGVKHRTCHCPA